MAFTAKKFDVDLALDLTVYIPGEAGRIDSTKKTAADMFAWSKFAATEADKIQALTETGSAKNADLVEEARAAIIRQIDWFYGKGPKYWEAIPFPVLKDLVTYLREEVTATEKK